MAADALDFPRLSQDTIDTLRARMTARVNLGIDPSSPLFLDAILGSIWLDIMSTGGLELDEYFDFANEVARAILPRTTFGEWLDGWAESVGLERKGDSASGGIVRFTGPAATVIPAATEVSTTAAATDADPVTFVTGGATVIPGGGFVDVEVVAVETGTIGNVPAATVTITELEGIAVSNPDPMTGGADVETDDALRERVLLALAGGQGAGTQADYVRWGLEDPGVGFVTVEPAWAGPGTVRMFITDVNNDPEPPAIIARVKARIDPVDGQGLGLAPIGAAVTVATPVPFPVDITVTIDHEPGYTLDGVGGTIATQPSIDAAVRAYIDGLAVGADVLRDKVIGAIVEVPGVLKTAGDLTINGLAVGDGPVAAGNVAFTDTVTLD